MIFKRSNSCLLGRNANHRFVVLTLRNGVQYNSSWANTDLMKVVRLMLHQVDLAACTSHALWLYQPVTAPLQTCWIHYHLGGTPGYYHVNEYVACTVYIWMNAGSCSNSLGFTRQFYASSLGCLSLLFTRETVKKLVQTEMSCEGCAPRLSAKVL